jgi:hypothetical protein
MSDEDRMTITEALELDEDSWHGVEPCEDCGIFHTPVWWHVDFDSDHPRAAELRALARAQSRGEIRPDSAALATALAGPLVADAIADLLVFPEEDGST